MENERGILGSNLVDLRSFPCTQKPWFIACTFNVLQTNFAIWSANHCMYLPIVPMCIEKNHSNSESVENWIDSDAEHRWETTCIPASFLPVIQKVSSFVLSYITRLLVSYHLACQRIVLEIFVSPSMPSPLLSISSGPTALFLMLLCCIIFDWSSDDITESAELKHSHISDVVEWMSGAWIDRLQGFELLQRVCFKEGGCIGRKRRFTDRGGRGG